MKYAAIAAVFFLQGCVTPLVPALAGKTVYQVKFQDQTAEQNTVYEMNIKAPAGVDLATVTGMQYKWDKDGSGNIAVSADGAVDTTVQADALVKINEDQLKALVNTTEALLSVLKVPTE